MKALLVALACAQHGALVESLADRYGEQKQSAGLTGEQVMEVYANPETGTWTVLMVSASGLACVVAAGTIWLIFDPEPQGEPM